eukprot:g983.t1
MSAVLSRSESLVQKLNHELVDIRLRAIRNLQSKLRNKLVDIHDLACNRTALRALLCRLHLPEGPLGRASAKGQAQLAWRREALLLLEELSRINFAVQFMLNAGGVMALRKVAESSSSHNDPAARSASTVLEELMKLPCDEALFNIQAPVPESKVKEKKYEHMESVPDNVISPPNKTSITFALRQIELAADEAAATDALNAVFRKQQQLNPRQLIRPASLLIQRAQREKRRGSTNYAELNDRSTELRYSGWRFPTVTLAKEDSQCLLEISIQLKLQSSESTKKALRLVAEAVLRDFPPEVLLQRSGGELFAQIIAATHSQPLQALPNSSSVGTFSAVTGQALAVVESLAVVLHHSASIRADAECVEQKEMQHLKHVDTKQLNPFRLRYPVVALDEGASDSTSRGITLPLRSGASLAFVCLAKLMTTPSTEGMPRVVATMRSLLPLLREPLPGNNNEEKGDDIECVHPEDAMECFAALSEVTCCHRKSLESLFLYNDDEKDKVDTTESAALLSFALLVVDSLSMVSPKKFGGQSKNMLIPVQLCKLLRLLATSDALECARPGVKEAVLPYISIADPAGAELVEHVALILDSLKETKKLLENNLDENLNILEDDNSDSSGVSETENVEKSVSPLSGRRTVVGSKTTAFTGRLQDQKVVQRPSDYKTREQRLAEQSRVTNAAKGATLRPSDLKTRSQRLREHNYTLDNQVSSSELSETNARIELLEKMLLGLRYSQDSADIITATAVRMAQSASNALTSTANLTGEDDASLQEYATVVCSRARTLLLGLLAHISPRVRRSAYMSLAAAISREHSKSPQSQGPEAAGDDLNVSRGGGFQDFSVTGSRHRHAFFRHIVLDVEILQQLLRFGLADTNADDSNNDVEESCGPCVSDGAFLLISWLSVVAAVEPTTLASFTPFASMLQAKALHEIGLRETQSESSRANDLGNLFEASASLAPAATRLLLRIQRLFHKASWVRNPAAEELSMVAAVALASDNEDGIMLDENTPPSQELLAWGKSVGINLALSDPMGALPSLPLGNADSLPFPAHGYAGYGAPVGTIGGMGGMDSNGVANLLDIVESTTLGAELRIAAVEQLTAALENGDATAPVQEDPELAESILNAGLDLLCVLKKSKNGNRPTHVGMRLERGIRLINALLGRSDDAVRIVSRDHQTIQQLLLVAFAEDTHCRSLAASALARLCFPLRLWQAADSRSRQYVRREMGDFTLDSKSSGCLLASEEAPEYFLLGRASGMPLLVEAVALESAHKPQRGPLLTKYVSARSSEMEWEQERDMLLRQIVRGSLANGQNEVSRFMTLPSLRFLAAHLDEEESQSNCSEFLERLRLLLHICRSDPDAAQAFSTQDVESNATEWWWVPFARFFEVAPATEEDDVVLAAVMRFVEWLFSSLEKTNPVRLALLERVGPKLLGLLNRSSAELEREKNVIEGMGAHVAELLRTDDYSRGSPFGLDGTWKEEASLSPADRTGPMPRRCLRVATLKLMRSMLVDSVEDDVMFPFVTKDEASNDPGANAAMAATFAKKLCDEYISAVSPDDYTRYVALLALGELPHRSIVESDSTSATSVVATLVHLAAAQRHTESFQRKGLLRACLHCLARFASLLPHSNLSIRPAWLSNGSMRWLTVLAGDREAVVREAAYSIMSCLARVDPDWFPDAAAATRRVLLDSTEGGAIKAAAAGTLAAVLRSLSAEEALHIVSRVLMDRKMDYEALSELPPALACGYVAILRETARHAPLRLAKKITERELWSSIFSLLGGEEDVTEDENGEERVRKGRWLAKAQVFHLLHNCLVVNGDDLPSNGILYGLHRATRLLFSFGIYTGFASRTSCTMSKEESALRAAAVRFITAVLCSAPDGVGVTCCPSPPDLEGMLYGKDIHLDVNVDDLDSKGKEQFARNAILRSLAIQVSPIAPERLRLFTCGAVAAMLERPLSGWNAWLGLDSGLSSEGDDSSMLSPHALLMCRRLVEMFLKFDALNGVPDETELLSRAVARQRRLRRKRAAAFAARANASEVLEEPDGEEMEKNVFENSFSEVDERRLRAERSVTRGLRAALERSACAKMAAVELGFACEIMKRLEQCRAAVQASRPSTNSNNNDISLNVSADTVVRGESKAEKGMIASLSMLQSAVVGHGGEITKTSFMSEGVIEFFQHTWQLAMVRPELMASLLRAICNFCSGEAASKARLSLSRAGLAGGQSIMQRLLEAVLRPPVAMGVRRGFTLGSNVSARSPRGDAMDQSRNVSMNLLPLALRVISNLCLEPKCLHQVLKSELLDTCLSGLRQVPVNSSPAALQLSRLHLLRGIATSSDEGRDYIIRAKGSLIGMRDNLAKHSSPAVRAATAVVVARLCSLRAAKTALLSSGFLRILVAQASGWHDGKFGGKEQAREGEEEVSEKVGSVRSTPIRVSPTSRKFSPRWNAWDTDKENQKVDFAKRQAAIGASWAAVRANSAVALWALVHNYAKAAGKLKSDKLLCESLLGARAELHLELNGENDIGGEGKLLAGTMESIDGVLGLIKE